MSYLSTFADNLAAIDGSVDSITALSTYMRLHSGEADELVDVGSWYNCFLRVGFHDDRFSAGLTDMAHSVGNNRRRFAAVHVVFSQ
jgi:hypothetical protein